MQRPMMRPESQDHVLAYVAVSFFFRENEAEVGARRHRRHPMTLSENMVEVSRHWRWLQP